MTIKEYNSRTGRQAKGMHCFQCDEDEVIPSYKQHGTRMYVDFLCSNCQDYIGLPVTEADGLNSLKCLLV